MISKIGVEDNENITGLAPIPKRKSASENPSFKGGVWPILLQGIQECEKNPMINVAVIDMFSAILPRTFVESLTNWFAGFEALRRESSGLIVNCLIPSWITYGGAICLNKFIMPKNTNMAPCWADTNLIEYAKETYTKSEAADKTADTIKTMFKNIEGFDGKNEKTKFSSLLSEEEINKYTEQFRKLTEKDYGRKDLEKEVDKIVKEVAAKTHIYENIKVSGNVEVGASTVSTLMQDTIRFLHEFNKNQKSEYKLSMEEFAKKSKKLVRSKSGVGLAIVLPLAASMQFINRWITSKLSGVKGAPIYEDYGQETNHENELKAKKGLLKQKVISITSMITVGLLSMMKKPSLNMLEFKGIFPTMDQARIISTTTFASRMAAADDKNELRESTVRDIATFLSLYFLGDYAAKAAATIIEKRTDVKLLNDTKKIDKNANAAKKFWHWFKDVKLKSSEEVVGKNAVNLRSACQLANLGVSLILLGLIIPIFTRKDTKKRHAKAMQIAQQNSSYNTAMTASTRGAATSSCA